MTYLKIFENIDWPIAVLFCALLLVFGLQILLTVKVRRLFWHFIPACVCVLVVIGFFVAVKCTEGWDAIAYLLLMIYSGIFLAADVTGLAIGYAVRYVRKKQRRGLIDRQIHPR